MTDAREYMISAERKAELDNEAAIADAKALLTAAGYRIVGPGEAAWQPKISRADFVRGYAERSNLSAEWAGLGIIDFGDRMKRFAMPCGCDDDTCEGWAMVSAESMISHLELYAPEPLAAVYRAMVKAEPALRTLQENSHGQ